jgi:hypothetical protein
MRTATRTINVPIPTLASEHLLRGFILICSWGLAGLLFGQSRLVDDRNQAEGWYLPVHGHVMIDGKNAEGYEITLYKQNEQLSKIEPGKKGKFELQLDIDQVYTLMVTKPGYEMKLIYIDTTLPKDLVEYQAYECFLNLLPVSTGNVDPFYHDFPGAIVRWNEEMGGFYHSEQYLTHIQTRLAGYATATF